LDIRIKQLGFEELGTECCAKGIIDEMVLTLLIISILEKIFLKV
jgi:hypothetical protein